LEELLKRLQDRHVECAQAVANKAVADAQGAAASPDTLSVMQAMMLFQQVKKRAKAAQDHAKAAQEQAKSVKKLPLEAEKENDVAQKEVKELQRVMEPKRGRTQSATTDDDEDCEKQDWDLPDHRREATHIQNHLSIPLGSHGEVPTPQDSNDTWDRDKRKNSQCEFGDADNATSCEKKFNLSHRKWEDYRGTRLYTGDSALVIKRWLNRVEEDTSALTFQEWTPDVDTSRTPVAMLINSSELRAAGFKLKEVIPPALEAAALVSASGDLRTRGSGLQSLEGMDPKRFVLSVDDDTEFRSRCEWKIPFCTLKYGIFK
jgi:hypothetical protein